MAVKNGTFVISLDYEIHWGVFDAMTMDAYGNNLKNVNIVLDRLMKMCDEYDVKLTFATVGMLFAKDKEELLQFNPSLIPSYDNQALNPFKLIDSIGKSELDDQLHYAQSKIKEIEESGDHEIGTHTYSHYNCLASGQTIEEFEQDIIAAKKIAEHVDMKVESVVFPKNQVNQPYLDVCYKHGILSYRGTEESGIYSGKGMKGFRKFRKMVRLTRLLDGYFNVTGHNTYDVDKLNAQGGIVNLPSSRFLRPYFSTLRFLEPLKMKRIKKSMQHAAKNNEMYHLWWHPHNFGANIEENFKNLEIIFKEYKNLKTNYGFESITMSDLTRKIINK